MRSMTLLRTAALLALSSFAALPALSRAQDPNQSTGDPVADAARKARAQQKAQPKPKHVITNDDMPSPPPDKQSATAPAASTTNAEAPQTDANQTVGDKDKDAADQKKDETYWRKRFQDLRGKLAAAEKELDVLQREENKNQVQYYSDPQKALVQQYNRSDINQGAAKVAAKQKEIDSLKQQLSDLEDDLRKSGGDPGWAR